MMVQTGEVKVQGELSGSALTLGRMGLGEPWMTLRPHDSGQAESSSDVTECL